MRSPRATGSPLTTAQYRKVMSSLRRKNKAGRTETVVAVAERLYHRERDRPGIVRREP
ncbi:MAG: hypothetical protein ACRDUW_05060 [Pseudonocardiaceae bacterium]